MSVDPLTADYPGWSPYPFAMNRVIDGIDLDGAEYRHYMELFLWSVEQFENIEDWWDSPLDGGEEELAGMIELHSDNWGEGSIKTKGQLYHAYLNWCLENIGSSGGGAPNFPSSKKLKPGQPKKVSTPVIQKSNKTKVAHTVESPPQKALPAGPPPPKALPPGPQPRKVGHLEGGPLENATQISGKFQTENGPINGTLYRADNQGNITSYATYDSQGIILKRVDVTGAAHAGVDTPHAIDYGRNYFFFKDGQATVKPKPPKTSEKPRNIKPEELP